MNQDRTAEKLRAVTDKVAFCRRHKLARRTMYRIIDGSANPTIGTLQKFVDALRREARKTRAEA
jgi:DNA-binding phage protein